MLLYISQGLKALRLAFSPAIIIEDLYLQRFFHRLYEAPTDCFKAFHADAERKRREQARRKKAGKDGYRLIHYEALSSEGISGEERIEDPNCDVEETALLHLQICELRKALSKLSPEAYELIQAIHFKNKSLRKYAAKKGLTTFAILYR